jgi:multicomponent Na+:H+ antiporter subunit A
VPESEDASRLETRLAAYSDVHGSIRPVIGLLILSPFLVAFPAAWFVSRFPHRAGMLAAWPAVLTIFLADGMRRTAWGSARLVELPWAPSLGLSLSFNLDGLGLLFATLITGIGALIVLYAGQYLRGHAQAGRFYASLFAFMGAMLGVALSDNMLTLFVFWELTGFTSFLLIGFEHERAAARAAAIQALIVTGAGGLALLAAAVLLVNVSGTANISALAAARAPIAASPSYVAIALLVLLAAFTKSAQVPFHFWLPKAMEAPTPVSAYLHSATMVKAGVYLIARMTPVLGSTPEWTIAVTAAGATTMVVGAYRSVQETDLKRILAYSTVSALGVLTMLLGVGTREAIIAALVYLVAHAGYKGALFLVAGVIEHETGTRDISTLTGLRRTMPISALAAGAAALSMAGVPVTLGFVGKDGAYEALIRAGNWYPWLLALMVLASILLGLAGLLAGMSPFLGKTAPMKRVHDPAWPLWFPPLVLATGGVLVGLAPSLLNGTLSAAASAVAGTPSNVSLSVWHGITPALLLSLLTLAAVGLAYVARLTIRTRTWRPRRGTGDAYEGMLSALNAVSRAIAPALHSASLRTYVMVIVVTVVVVGGTALLNDPGLGSAVPRTSITVHDILIVVVIMAGAIATTVAQSTMAAVLSLGAVGYGVAMMFLSFGAPDLAMTQFSVETLTVLIYVLVFRHFRTLGALSSGLVRARDALIAAAIGIFIGGLLLSVATTETAPRLREYFAQFGPTLGHGRNIVNVILVDFRAFDTLGEITVLATAAIGVRGLLRLAANGHRENETVQPLTSPIFRTAARLLMPLLLLFSLFLLLRGHNEPGGGFVGGLIAAAAFALYAIAFGVRRARQALLVKPMTLLGAGLLIALLSGLPAVVRGRPFLAALWASGPVAVGTPAVFDAGVFLVVAGVALMMIFSLGEES